MGITARLWNTTDGTLIKTFRHEGWVNSCAFSFDDKLIVTACHDKIVRIWDTQRGQLKHTLDGHSAYVRYSCFSGDGNRVVSASYHDKTARIWDANSGEMLSGFLFNNGANSCDFTPHP